jgi:P27 family predicted phage terminase small subunit
MRGRKPTPTYLKLIRGNPGKRALPKGEPMPTREAEPPPPPAYLDGLARQEWDRIAPELHRMRLFTVLDRNALAVYCEVFQRWRECEEALAKVSGEGDQTHGLLIRTRKGGVMISPLYLAARQAMADMVKLGTEFGFSPAARARLSTGAAPPAPGGPGTKFHGLIA